MFSELPAPCSSLLIHVHVESQSTQFVQQYVERFGNSRCGQVLAFHDGFICFCTAYYVIRLDGEDLLENVGGTECFERPHFHFPETLSTELRLTTQRLLRDE